MILSNLNIKLSVRKLSRSHIESLYSVKLYCGVVFRVPSWVILCPYTVVNDVLYGRFYFVLKMNTFCLPEIFVELYLLYVSSC